MDEPILIQLTFNKLERYLYANAACHGQDPTLYDTINPDSLAAQTALAICAICPVKAECLAVLKPETVNYDGIVGGKVWRGGKIQIPGIRTTLW